MAQKDKIFLDTKVVLDHLADRQPFAEYSHRIFGLAEKPEISLCAASLSFTNLYYILRKLNGHSDAMAMLGKLKLLVRVTPVAEGEIQSALGSHFKDFEDAVQYSAAKAEGGVTTILTRNKDDFAGSDIAVLSPEEYLAAREAQAGS
jgi:predicted nucleic acid-binding protein